MNAVLSPRRMTAQEYLDRETLRAFKNEYVDGEIFAMSGARINHNVIFPNAAFWMRRSLQGAL